MLIITVSRQAVSQMTMKQCGCNNCVKTGCEPDDVYNDVLNCNNCVKTGCEPDDDEAMWF